MPLEAGSRLGSYEILEPIGAGGMGEVYKARDTRLDRLVAIKVLPGHLAQDSGRRERLEREARAVSSLNHPNICTLHDIGSQDGVDFLVLEYLEGESLADRLERGALPLQEALRHASSLADALGKAHRQGVVHRDLKPGNVFLTKDGAKLLDFGLAKIAGAADEVQALSSLATQAKPLTAEGAILGTFRYMAPEQLEGGEVDARTDIFAFGALLYEMVTGRKAFDGKSQASLIAAILEKEPEAIASVHPMSPPELDRIVARCLAKDPDARWQSAFDLAAEIRWVSENAPRGEVISSRRISSFVAPLLLGALVAAFATWMLLRAPASEKRSPIRLSLTFAEDQRLPAGGIRPFALSHDGRQLVFVAREPGTRGQLYLRPLDQFESRPIPGTEGASGPVFSPDGRFVAFWSGGRLLKTSTEGGQPILICDLPSSTNAEWGEDDTIYFGADSGLFRVPASGGTPEPITTVDTESGENGHLFPRLLPDGETLLFTVRKASGFETAVLSLTSGKRRTLVELGQASSARYASSGHLLYTDGTSVMAVPFDLGELELAGSPVAVLGDVQIRPGRGQAQLSMSRDGTIAYTPGAGVEAALLSIDRNGSASRLFEDTDFFHFPRLSPDGRELAVSIHPPGAGGHDLWLYDLGRKTRRRLTSADDNNFPVWAPGGGRLAFESVAADLTSRLSILATEGGGGPDVVTSSDEARLQPSSWSSHGRALAYVVNPPQGGSDVWIHDLEPGKEGSPFLDSAFNEDTPCFSPNGEWLAYVSDESGESEIYVVSYPGKERTIAISKGGGRGPLWSADGKELFYRDLEGDRLYTVPVESGAEPSFGEPRLLFEGSSAFALYAGTNYDVSADGQTFYMVREIVKPSLNLVVNWFTELEERAPRN